MLQAEVVKSGAVCVMHSWNEIPVSKQFCAGAWRYGRRADTYSCQHVPAPGGRCRYWWIGSSHKCRWQCLVKAGKRCPPGLQRQRPTGSSSDRWQDMARRNALQWPLYAWVCRHCFFYVGFYQSNFMLAWYILWPCVCLSQAGQTADFFLVPAWTEQNFFVTLEFENGSTAVVMKWWKQDLS